MVETERKVIVDLRTKQFLGGLVAGLAIGFIFDLPQTTVTIVKNWDEN